MKTFGSGQLAPHRRYVGPVHLAVDFNTEAGYGAGDGFLGPVTFQRAEREVPGLLSTNLNNGPAYQDDFYPVDSSEPGMNQLLDSYSWVGASPGTLSLTLEDLTVGLEYTIQLFGIADSRDCCGDRTYQPDNGTGEFITDPTFHLKRSDHISIIGTFVADANTQTVQLRSLDNDPIHAEPGLAGLAVWRSGDAYEPNDSFNEAYELTGVEGALSLLDGRGVSSDFDRDTYSFVDIGPDEQVLFEFIPVNQEASSKISLLDGNGFLNHFYEVVGSKKFVHLSGAETAIVVSSASEYDLKWSVVPKGTVTWEEAVTVSEASDILAPSGAQLHLAADFNSAAGFNAEDSVINGVPFQAVSQSVSGLLATDLNSGPVPAEVFFPGTTDDPDLDALLRSTSWKTEAPGVSTIELQGLNPGGIYQVQLIMADQRPCCADRQYETDNGFGAFGGSLIQRGLAHSVVGSFVASGEVQTIQLRSAGGDAINADPMLSGLVVWRLNDNYGSNYIRELATDLRGYPGVPLSRINGLAKAEAEIFDWYQIELQDPYDALDINIEGIQQGLVLIYDSENEQRLVQFLENGRILLPASEEESFLIAIYNLGEDSRYDLTWNGIHQNHVNWRTPITLDEASDLENDGILHLAADFNTAGGFGPGDQTINGIPFERMDLSHPKLSTGFDAGPDFNPGFLTSPPTDDVDLDALLQSHSWKWGAPGNTNITLRELQPGARYRVSLIVVADDRDCCRDRQYQVDDGYGSWHDVPVRRGSHQVITGEFTAVAELQDIGIRSLDNEAVNNDPGLSGIVVHQIQDAYFDNRQLDGAYDLSSFEGRWLSEIAGLGQFGLSTENDHFLINVEPGFENVRFDWMGPINDIQVSIDRQTVRPQATNTEFSILVTSPGEQIVRVSNRFAHTEGFDLRWSSSVPDADMDHLSDTYERSHLGAGVLEDFLPNDNLDGDEFPNWAEFVLNLDPNKRNADIGARGYIDSGYFYLEFFRRRDAMALGYTAIVEEIPDLDVAEARAAEFVSAVNQGDGTDLVTYRCAQPVAQNVKNYLRVKVGQPDPGP